MNKLQNNGLRLYTLAGSDKDIDINKYKVKRYTHFDNRISIHQIIDDIRNPDWVARHGFYPFIHFPLKFYKYSKLEKRKKSKCRHIYYASHIDSYIYKYYGDILNNKYNDLMIKLQMNEVATAYRNNFDGKCNIHFAKEVIDFIKKEEKAFVYITDFSKFFDSLDHKYLKRQMENILDEERLPDDYYAVFRNLTKFSWIDKRDIETVLKKKYKTKDKIKKATKFRYFDTKEFRKFREADAIKKSEEKNIETNEDNFGIPQGAGLSSVCSNIYLIDFDKEINDYVKSNNGIYRRYSDDLIIVIPFEEEIKNYNYNVHMNFIGEATNKIPRLKIQQEKTESYIYHNNQILDESLVQSHLDYLGFTFDGHNVKIREKSMFKFYSRTYKKVKLSNWKTADSGRKKHRKSLYSNYTHLGKKRKGYGNFLTYVSRAEEIFDQESTTNNLMEYQVKNHWRNINRRLE